MSDGTHPDPEHAPEFSELEALARRLRRGEDVVGEWFRCAYPLVHRLCRGFTASGPDADDYAQEAMVRLVDRIDSWDTERSYLGWQRVVVLNVCRNQRRAASRRREHEDNAAGERMTQTQSTPLDDAVRGELGTLVERFLSVLPPREREAFVLCDLEGLRPIDAAEVMGVADSTVRAALTLARRRMREALDRVLPNEGGRL